MSTKSISIKKSQVRDKYGIYIPPTSQDSKVGTSLKAENHALLDRISHLKKYASWEPQKKYGVGFRVKPFQKHLPIWRMSNRVKKGFYSFVFGL